MMLVVGAGFFSFEILFSEIMVAVVFAARIIEEMFFLPFYQSCVLYSEIGNALLYLYFKKIGS